MGIALVYRFDRGTSCVDGLYKAIFNINHTGQEHCGMACYNGREFLRQTRNGLVRELRISDDVSGYCGVGNVNKFNDHQPLIFCPTNGLPRFALTFDGFIANRHELKQRMDAVLSPADAELAGRIIARGETLSDGIEILSKGVKGYFCIGVVSECGEAYAARSPLGTKPLMVGTNNKGCAAISESRAFRKISIKEIRDLKAGEIVRIDDDGVQTVNIVEGGGKKLCSFLYGYYSWIDSVVEGLPVSDVRELAMKPLADRDERAGLVVDCSTAIEDSGKGYGEGYQLHRGIPFRSTIIKYPYAVRSYDRPDMERSDEAEGKVSSVDARLEGNDIVLCDDSVRRGTVTREGPIHYARDAGVGKIHLRIGTPRNTHYCRLDFTNASDETLPANRYPTNEEMARFLGVDSVDFPTVNEFVDAIMEVARKRGSDLKREDLCLGCYTGDFWFVE